MNFINLNASCLNFLNYGTVPIRRYITSPNLKLGTLACCPSEKMSPYWRAELLWWVGGELHHQGQEVGAPPRPLQGGQAGQDGRQEPTQQGSSLFTPLNKNK
jgi:hypothetical protein